MIFLRKGRDRGESEKSRGEVRDRISGYTHHVLKAIKEKRGEKVHLAKTGRDIEGNCRSVEGKSNIGSKKKEKAEVV